MPKTNEAFWISKFSKNVARDNAVLEALLSLGWGVLIIWECEAKNPEKLEIIIRSISEKIPAHPS